MKAFKKNRPPKALVEFQKKIDDPQNHTPVDTYDALKNDEVVNLGVQLSLAQEQGFLCCYCMRKLETYEDAYDRVRVKIEIEHYKPKSIFNGTKNLPSKNKLLCDRKSKKRADLRIKYSNLLGACRTEGQCGNTKGDIELCHIPNPSQTKKSQFPSFAYNMKGKIRVADKYDDRTKEAITNELETVLCLNNEDMKSRRVNSWVGIKRKIRNHCKIKRLHRGGQKEINYVRELLELYGNMNSEGKYFEYYPFIIHLLKREYKGYL